MSITIIDVAKKANVSKSTVSLVINNAPTVKAETRQRVLEVIDELGYVPNFNARGLTTKKTNSLGVLITPEKDTTESPFDFQNETEFFSYDILAGIPDGLENTDYGLVIERYCMKNSDEHPLPEMISQRRVDGVIIIAGLYDDEFENRILESGIPAVVVGRPQSVFDSVSVDIEQGIYLATEKLISVGIKKICYINCPSIFSSNQRRRNGFYHAINDYHLYEEDQRVVDTEWNTGKGGYEAIKNLFVSGYRPDGIVAAHDSIALGIMRYMYENEIRIPRDISIISFENSVLSGYAAPALSTVDINKRELGKKAGELLVQRIEKPKMPKATLLYTPTVINRDSVYQRD